MDMSSICRACLLTCEEMFSLFAQLDLVGEATVLAEMLTACTTVQINSSDGLPDLICKTCVLDLSNAYNFKLKCEKTDVTLRQCLNDENSLTEIAENVNDQIIKEEDINLELSENLDQTENIVIEEDAFADRSSPIGDEPNDSEDAEMDDIKNESFSTTGDRYVCTECKASLSTIGNLQRHMKIHQTKEIQCTQCERTFAKTDALEHHIKKIHKTEFECSVCQKSCSSKAALTGHMYTHDRGNGNGKSSKVKERVHECSYCKKSFLSNSSLVIHIRTHTKEKPYLCQICGKGFATRGGVDLHQRRHTGEKPFKCEYCGRGFAESSNLKVHIRAHTGDKPHLCSLCGKRFTRTFLLQLHVRTHTGEKPYACTDCPKAFAQQGDLAAHKRTHTGQRPHKCAYCDQGFIKSSGLKKHVQSKHSKEVVQAEIIAEIIIPKAEAENLEDFVTSEMEESSQVMETNSITIDT